MKILFVCSEMAPFAKTGGLGDVSAALTRQLRRAGHDVRAVLPLSDVVDTSKARFEVVVDGIDLWLGAHRYEAKIVLGGGEAFFVHCPALYARGRLYTSDGDEHLRFLALSYAALVACQRMGFAPDIVHANDWQAALLPLLLKTRFAGAPQFANSRTLLTIHNLNYQGIFSAGIVPDTNLQGQAHLFHQDQLAAGRLNFLLHGIIYADGVSTVSPTYAREIQSPEHGAGLDPFLRARSSTVIGILNGVDYEQWSPERDRHIPHRYDALDPSGKARDKEALLLALGLPHRPGVPVVGVVSRLVYQKGFDLCDPLLFDLLHRHGFQLVVLGSGEPSLEELFATLQRAFPQQVCFYRGFHDPLAHLIEAGSDIFLMPSRYEPCGLSQMYSLRYGTVPIVHRTGGLADTVRPWDARTGEGTGFCFEWHDQAGLRWGIEAALAAYRQPEQWRRLMQNAMAEDFSWESRAKVYEKVYDLLVSQQRG